jgi:putative membrane protein
MTWWCSAGVEPWTWRWKPYLGVWIFLTILVLGYRVLTRDVRSEPGFKGGRWFAAGIALLWLSLDWPIGKMAGYLASAHTIQFMLLALAAPPLLLLGLAPYFDRRLPERGLGHRLAHPLPAFLIFNAILIVTHFPDVVEGMMATQLGSFGLDILWFASGLALWWPVTAPTRLRRMNPPVQMGYLFVQTVPSTIPAAFLVFSDYPLYQLYEDSPRVALSFNPLFDHQVAGLLMKVVGDPIVWVGIAVIFFSWASRERRLDREYQATVRARATQEPSPTRAS